jgi:hypothetical protein
MEETTGGVESVKERAQRAALATRMEDEEGNSSCDLAFARG